MRRWYPLFVLLPWLAGCVALPDGRAEREAALGGLIGQPESDLVRQFGVPSRVYDANGHRFLAYVERRVDYLPGFAPFRPYGYGFGYGPDFPPEIVQRTCETTFEVVDAKVFSFALRGNACR